jgi:nucleotide-binding universal stress UspA family protein
MLFNQILLAVDRTSKADKVFAQGVDIANQYQARLCLMHCMASATSTAIGAGVPPAGVGYPWPSAILPSASTPTMAGAPLDSSQNNYDRLVNVVQEWLQEYQQKAYQAGCQNVRYEIRMGNPGDRICELATELTADLIIL